MGSALRGEERKWSAMIWIMRTGGEQVWRQMVTPRLCFAIQAFARKLIAEVKKANDKGIIAD